MIAANPWAQAEKHLAASDPYMAGLIEKYGPCRLTPHSDYFAILCDSIISQQLATKAADAIAKRFAAHYGGRPAPEKIAATAPQTLRELGLSGQKCKYMLDLAAKTLDGHIAFDRFAAMPDEEITARLTGVKGIGVWTAQMFLIFALNRPDILPTDDFGIRKAFMLGYGLGEMPDKKTMAALAAPWRPWRSAASWYLWRSLENKNN